MFTAAAAKAAPRRSEGLLPRARGRCVVSPGLCKEAEVLEKALMASAGAEQAVSIPELANELAHSLSLQLFNIQYESLHINAAPIYNKKAYTLLESENELAKI